MREPKTVRCADCESVLEADLVCPDCMLRDLETMDEVRAREVMQQMGKHLKQQLEEIKNRCERLGVKI